MDSKSFVSRELWVDLTRSYRETLNTALNLCSNIESVVKRVELGRIHVGDALLRIEELCMVTKCSDFLDDDGFLNQVLGVTFPTPQDLSSPDERVRTCRRMTPLLAAVSGCAARGRLLWGSSTGRKTASCCSSSTAPLFRSSCSGGWGSLAKTGPNTRRPTPKNFPPQHDCCSESWVLAASG